MSAPVLFDTNILIDYLCAREQARTEIDSHSNAAISVITWMEVMAGSVPRNEAATREFLLHFESLPVTDRVAGLAFQIRRERKVKLPDAIILATALNAGRVLVTRNTRDFPADTPGVRVPYTL